MMEEEHGMVFSFTRQHDDVDSRRRVLNNTFPLHPPRLAITSSWSAMIIVAFPETGISLVALATRMLVLQPKDVDHVSTIFCGLRGIEMIMHLQAVLYNTAFESYTSIPDLETDKYSLL